MIGTEGGVGEIQSYKWNIFLLYAVSSDGSRDHEEYMLKLYTIGVGSNDKMQHHIFKKTLQKCFLLCFLYCLSKRLMQKTVHSTTECGLTACTGSLVSPWAQKLWQWTSWGFSSQKPSHSITPPNHKTITRTSQGRSGGGKRDLEETANPPQQQLFPNHNNLGKGCGLYFMGGEGLWMFIYLSQQSALRCACVFTQDLSSLSALFYFTFTFTLNSNICQSCV